MSPVALQVSGVAGLLGIAVLAIVLSRGRSATAIVYGLTLAVSLLALFGSFQSLLGGVPDTSDLTLPIGLPWLGAHWW
jgi:hydrogenase-4 component B